MQSRKQSSWQQSKDFVKRTQAVSVQYMSRCACRSPRRCIERAGERTHQCRVAAPPATIVQISSALNLTTIRSLTFGVQVVSSVHPHDLEAFREGVMAAIEAADGAQDLQRALARRIDQRSMKMRHGRPQAAAHVPRVCSPRVLSGREGSRVTPTPIDDASEPSGSAVPPPPEDVCEQAYEVDRSWLEVERQITENPSGVKEMLAALTDGHFELVPVGEARDEEDGDSIGSSASESSEDDDEGEDDGEGDFCEEASMDEDCADEGAGADEAGDEEAGNSGESDGAEVVRKRKRGLKMPNKFYQALCRANRCTPAECQDMDDFVVTAPDVDYALVVQKRYGWEVCDGVRLGQQTAEGE